MIEPITITSPWFALLAIMSVLAGQLGNGRALPHCLALAGLVIAVSWLDPIKATLFIVSIGSNYLVVQYLWGRPERGTSVVVGTAVIFHTALLCLTKLGPVSASLGVADLIGLSYMTFRQIHIVVEAPDQDGRLPVHTYLAYLLNPLALIAGPIQLWASHKEGLGNPKRLNEQRAVRGAHRITTGLLKVMVFAPMFAGQYDPASVQGQNTALLELLIFLYSYYIFLYLDFSGYIDIVRGVAIISGFDTLPENFRRPYFAENFQQFWTRWNITLGQWFRMYLFNPVFGSLLRSRFGERDAFCVAGALFITFFTVGLWHGLAWNFVVFGLIQATGVAIVPLSREWAVSRFGNDAVVAYEKNKALKVVRIVICQHCIAASFLLLDNDVADLWALLTL